MDVSSPPVSRTSVPPRRRRGTVRKKAEQFEPGPPARVRRGLATLAGGLAALSAGLLWLDGSPLLIRLLLVGIGVVASYRGARALSKALIGPSFDLSVWLAGAWLVALLVAAVLAPVLPLGEHVDTAATLAVPGMSPPDLFSDHPLGTNAFGLDELARALYGARASLMVAGLAVVLGLVIGGVIGLVAGYLGGATDWVVGVLTTTVLAFPPLILLLTLATVLRPSILSIAVALSVLALPTVVRLSRANTMMYAEREFVTAARSLGASRRTVIFRELLPNVLLPVASYGMVLVAVLIVAEAGLSFLGLGIQPPAPTWGNMIAEAQNGVMERSPHILLVPATFLFLTVLSLNILGEVARRRFAPRESRL